MPSNRPRYDRLDDEEEQLQEQERQVEHATSVKVTWIANHLYQSLNEKRELERDRLNRRLANADLLPRLSRTIQRPRGEAGRTGTTSSGQRRSGFVLKEFLQRESNLNDIHYTMIQNTVHRLAAKHLDIRRTWRENQGNGLVTVCLEAAKLHPCLYDYDAFWPVHDHLKQHLKSTRDKYDYVDPDLAPLTAAEEAAREMDAPPPRKKQRTSVKGKQPDAHRSLAPSPDPFDHAVNVSQPLHLPRPLERHRDVHPQACAPPAFQRQGEPQPLQRTSSSQPLLPVQPSQRTDGHFETGIGNAKADDREFLMTLRDRLIAQGHPLRGDLPLRPQIWKILLGVKQCDTTEYDRYVRKGPSSLGGTITSNTQLTPPFHPLFRDDGLARVTNAFVWRWEESKPCRPYIRVVYWYAYMFLYIMSSEAEAFYCLEAFVKWCPIYAEFGQYERELHSFGLVARCLERLDEDLHVYLESNHLSMGDSDWNRIRTFSACDHPSGEVTKLWDFFLSYGLHMNTLVAVCRMSMSRLAIMNSSVPSSRKVLSGFPIPDAEFVIRRTLDLEQRLPRDLLDTLKKHLVKGIDIWDDV